MVLAFAMGIVVYLFYLAHHLAKRKHYQFQQYYSTSVKGSLMRVYTLLCMIVILSFAYNIMQKDFHCSDCYSQGPYNST